MSSTKPVGYFKEDGKTKPVHARRSSKGRYEEELKKRVPYAPKYSGGRTQTLKPRFKWLLTKMCRNMGVDTMLIDDTLTYWENKEEIERQAQVKLHILPDKAEEEGPPPRPREWRTETREEEEFKEYLASREKYEKLAHAKPKLYEKDTWVNVTMESKPYRVVSDKGGLIKLAQWNFAMGRETYSEVPRHMIEGKAKPPEPYVGGVASYNKATGWMEISFGEKPSEQIRAGLKAQGFRYRPRRKTWGAKWNTEREDYAKALVGEMVEVDIKPNWEKKAEYSEAQALKHQKESNERYEQFRKELKTIPLGQPILVGHHSEKSHRAHLKRLDNQLQKSIEEKQIAEKYRERAKRYRRKAVGEDPGLIYRRIRKLEAEKRKCERWRAQGYDKERYTRTIQRLNEQIKLEKEKYNLSGGILTDKIELKKGDRVRTQIGPAKVIRVNPKTVTVESSKTGWKIKLDKSRIYGKEE